VGVCASCFWQNSKPMKMRTVSSRRSSSVTNLCRNGTDDLPYFCTLASPPVLHLSAYFWITMTTKTTSGFLGKQCERLGLAMIRRVWVNVRFVKRKEKSDLCNVFLDTTLRSGCVEMEETQLKMWVSTSFWKSKHMTKDYLLTNVIGLCRII